MAHHSIKIRHRPKINEAVSDLDAAIGWHKKYK